MALRRAANIIEKWDHLFHIVGQHEEIIKKRWSNKSKPKRKALLLEAWPNMSAMHCPDVARWMSKSPGPTPIPEGRHDKFLEPFLWPYINLEDMCKTDSLLSMLNSRARCAPDTFVSADLLSINFGIRVGIIPQIDLRRHFMIFRGRDRPETYGQLYSSDDNHDDIKSEPTRFFYTPGDGLCILHIQSRIYEFLFGCCTLILHDMPPEMFFPAPHTNPPDTPARTKSEGTEILSDTEFKERYKEQGDADFGRVVTLVKAELSRAEDHLLALREDPGYFVASMKDRYEHMHERLLDNNDEPHPTSLNGQADVFSGEVIRFQVVEAVEHVSRLRELIGADSPAFSPDRDLPSKLTDALFDANHFILRSMRSFLKKDIFRLGVYCSPPIRGQFRRPSLGNLYPTVENLPVIQWYNSDFTEAKETLLKLLDMVTNGAMLTVMGYRGIVTEIDLLIKRASELKHLISPWVAEKISTIGVLLECLHQIRLFEPWILGYEMQYFHHKDEREQIWQDAHRSCTRLFSNELQFWHGLSPLLDNFKDEAFDYPTQKPPSEKVTVAKRLAEDTLDTFWTAVVRSLKNNNALPSRPAFVFCLDLQRTPVWTEPPKATKKGKKKADKIEDAFDKLMIEVRKENAMMMKERKKTSSAEDSPIESFQVDKRTLKVFDVLLFDGPDPSRLGEVSWADFVHSMTDTGLDATKMFGYVWLFRPSDLESDVGDGILLMEPYNTGKLTHVMARHYGRRLRAVYGWKRDMFTLAS
ncbi:hypothetical protein K449DRAFT_459083 [Hypoxylon sp. EC38]|nr:hypothetical protein K449DRAFT_459083 [Hypoxylon sp. EC38]